MSFGPIVARFPFLIPLSLTHLCLLSTLGLLSGCPAGWRGGGGWGGGGTEEARFSQEWSVEHAAHRGCEVASEGCRKDTYICKHTGQDQDRQSRLHPPLSSRNGLSTIRKAFTQHRVAGKSVQCVNNNSTKKKGCRYSFFFIPIELRQRQEGREHTKGRKGGKETVSCCV